MWLNVCQLVNISSLSLLHFYIIQWMFELRDAVSCAIALALPCSTKISLILYIYSLPKILSLLWFCLLFAIFQQVSDLSYLHWLPVHYRVQFKIATLTYNTLATSHPSYLYNLLQVHQWSRALRSSTQKLIQVTFLSTDRHAVGTPSTTAPLQHGIQFLLRLKISSLYSFKYHLKSHLIDLLINN